MRSQLAFSWRSAAPKQAQYTEEEGDEDGDEVEDANQYEEASQTQTRGPYDRRVKFAVQNVPPSPLVYHAHRDASPYSEEHTIEPPHSRSAQPVSHGNRSRPTPTSTRRQTSNASKPSNKPSQPAKPRKPKSRVKPDWNDHLARDSGLFDGSLKKSSLFHARPGDRRRQVKLEEVYTLDRPSAKAKSTLKAADTPHSRQAAPVSTKPREKQREPRSSGYMAPSTYRLPAKPRKDYVKQNIEQITGRPIEAANSKGKREARPKNVFARLYIPRATDSVLRTRPWKNDELHRNQDASAISFHDQIHQQAFLPMHSPTTPSPRPPESANSIHSKTEQEGQLENHSPKSQQSAFTSESNRRSNPRSVNQSPKSARSKSPPGCRARSSPDGRGQHGSKTRGQPSYPARVFAVLDRNEQKRIGVDQILQGLRLLGLPATHNQISDYVYLIHDGRWNTIDLEEWEILVGTLDAASRPVETLQSLARSETHSQRSAFSLSSPSQHSPQLSSPHGISRYGDHTNERQPSLSTFGGRGISPGASARESSPGVRTMASRQLETDENESLHNDPVVQSVEHYVDEMCHQAGATSVHWNSNFPNSNQAHHTSRALPGHMLNRATAVVHKLKASLFPLVHQAEEALRDIRKRHGCRLSVILSPEELKAIAHNSEALSSAILDDILLDTVQLLNDEETAHSQRLVAAHHADQLDGILLQIQQIEEAEHQLQREHSMPTFFLHSTPLIETAESTTERQQRETKGSKVEATKDHSSIVLPLEVVMNIKLPSDTDTRETEICKSSTRLALNEVQQMAAPPNLRLHSALPVIKTNVLQGKCLQSIEKRRTKFLKHRRLVEAALTDTGMTQSAVIEILEEMMILDIIEEAASELEDTVGTISETVVANLL